MLLKVINKSKCLTDEKDKQQTKNIDFVPVSIHQSVIHSSQEPFSSFPSHRKESPVCQQPSCEIENK